jgi:hypothetical protein
LEKIGGLAESSGVSSFSDAISTGNQKRAMAAGERRKFESVETLLLKTPLYEEVAVESRANVVREVMTYSGTLDTYCTGCKQTATFRGQVTPETLQIVRFAEAAVPHSRGSYQNPWDRRDISKTLVCTRNGHSLAYHFVCEDKFLVKVGQYPSIADIEKGDTDRFGAVLGRDRLKELNRGIGLAAHGVGIGAHVYLRRIFESLVEEAHSIAQQDKGWDESKYLQARMVERIQLLQHQLPRFLCENPRLYAIMSKGIHELTEQECLANFEALKLCIEVILEEKLVERAKRDRAEAARKALAQIDGKGKG